MKKNSQLILLSSIFSLFGALDPLSSHTFLEVSDYKPPPSEIIEEPGGFDEGPDLEEMVQDFVLETKRISIPDFPDAFNPSIIRWQDRFLMCFRTYQPKTRSTNEIAFIYLNHQFELLGKPKFLKFLQPDPCCGMKKQDPRLVAVDGQLHVVYNNSISGEVRRMLVGRIEAEGDDFVVRSSQCFMQFDGEREVRSEKNWVPFDYKNRLYFAYSIIPHKILLPQIDLGVCTTISSTLSHLKWNWGVLRGGTPALLDGDDYLAFFHSAKTMATQHSKGKNIPHYFMGAYTFSAHPPFHLLRISPQPIVGKNFYKGPAYKTWKPVRVVFPGGYVADEQFIWILYGRQDHEIWVAKLDKKALLNSLVPVVQ